MQMRVFVYLQKIKKIFLQAHESMPLLSGSVVHVIKAIPWPSGRWASCSTTWCRATSPSRRTSRSATPRWTSAATCRRSARSWSEAAFASDPRTGWTCLTCSTTPGSPPQLEEVMGRRGEAAMRTYHHTMDTSPLQLPLENRCSLPPAAICHPPVTNKQTKKQQLSIHHLGEDLDLSLWGDIFCPSSRWRTRGKPEN